MISLNYSVSSLASGVHRLLDARGQRGYWMPSKIFFYSSIHPATFLTTFLGPFTKFFLIRLLKSFLQHFSLFRISCQISRKFAPWMPPIAASRSGNDIFLFLFVITYIFYKNLPLGCPSGCVPGAVAPFAPPLHATESCSDNVQSNGSLSRIYKIFVQVELR